MQSVNKVAKDELKKEAKIKKLMRDDIIIIERNKEKALLAGCDSSVFYSALQSKLSWSGGPNA